MSRSLRKRFVLMDDAPGGGGGGAPAAPAAPVVSAGAAALAPTAPAAPAAPAATAAPAPGADWTAGIQNPELKDWLTAKGFKDPAAVAESAWNGEKLFGLDKAGRTIVIPKPDAPPAEIAAYREKLGVPAKAEGYELAKIEGMDPAASKVAETWMHKAGISKDAAVALAKEQIAHTVAAQTAAGQAFVIQSNADMEALRGTWGAAFEQKAEAARRGAMQFLPEKTMVNVGGVPTEVDRAGLMNHMERFLGTKGFMTFMENIGSQVGEHKSVEPGSQGGGNAILTPAEAKTKIAQLKADPVFVVALQKGGKDSAQQAEMTKLHKMAYPPEEGGSAPGL